MIVTPKTNIIIADSQQIVLFDDNLSFKSKTRFNATFIGMLPTELMVICEDSLRILDRETLGTIF